MVQVHITLFILKRIMFGCYDFMKKLCNYYIRKTEMIDLDLYRWLLCDKTQNIKTLNYVYDERRYSFDIETHFWIEKQNLQRSK